MPRTLRKVSYARGISNLIHSLIFVVAFTSITLSLFLFSPERYMSIRISILSAACIALLVSAGGLTKRRRRMVRMPLMFLCIAGVFFTCWGGIMITKALMYYADISVVAGAQFILFGVVTFLTAAFARR